MLGQVGYASTLYFPINISTINIISYLRTKFEQNDAPCSKERNKHFCHFEKCDGHIITTNIRNVYISHLSSSYSYLTLPCQADRLQSAFFVIKIKSNHLAIERIFSFPPNLVLAFFCKTALRFVSFGSILSLFFLSYCVLKTASKYDCLVCWSHHLFTSGPASLERFMQDCKIHCEIHFSL